MSHKTIGDPDAIADGQDAPLQAPDAPAEPPTGDPGVSTPENDQTTQADDTADVTEDDQDHGGNREAARYRRKLRDTEAERDALAARIESMQRAEAERLAGEHLEKGIAVWVDGTELADLLDTDGNVDPKKVADRAKHVRDNFGISKRRRLVAAREGNNPQTVSSGSMVDVVMGRQ